MKVTVEFNNSLDARIALQAGAYAEFLEEFERFLTSSPGHISRVEICDKFSILRDLYKI